MSLNQNWMSNDRLPKALEPRDLLEIRMELKEEQSRLRNMEQELNSAAIDFAMKECPHALTINWARLGRVITGRKKR